MLRLKRLLHLPSSTFPFPVTVSRLLSNASHDVPMIPVNHKEIRSVTPSEPIVFGDSLHPTLPWLSLGKIGYIQRRRSSSNQSGGLIIRRQSLPFRTRPLLVTQIFIELLGLRPPGLEDPKPSTPCCFRAGTGWRQPWAL